MKILIALLVFSVIVLFHELGHFLLAKRNGISVTAIPFSSGKEKWYRSHRVLPGDGAEASFYRKRRNQILFETFSYRRLLYDGRRR